MPPRFQQTPLSLALTLMLLGTLVAGQHASAQTLSQASAAQAQVDAVNAAATIRYEVRFDSAAMHLVDITATTQVNGRKQLEWYLPNWTPGSYLLRAHSQHVVQIDAVDPVSGNALPIEKAATNRWVVKTDSADAVELRYQLYCNEMTVRTNFVDASMALINGAATFLSLDSAREQTHRVDYVLPLGWKSVVTELPREESSGGKVANAFVAKTYDELVDAPAVVGDPTVVEFQVADRTHRLVCIGDHSLWNLDVVVKDLKQIVETQHAFWGAVPYQQYAFINVIGESGGGLEHDNSTVVMSSRWTQGIAKRYRGFLALCSHEFFHTWNVRRLRPQGIKKYDYQNEQLFPELWIAEGVTSYYDDLLTRRSGLSSPMHYLDAVSKNIEKLQTTPGRGQQSLAASSTDAWIKFYRPNADSPNHQVSYYTKGGLAAWLLDVEIRNATGHRKSLDDVMRVCFDRHAASGYTSSDFRKVVAEVAGKDLSPWFAKHIDGTDELNFTSALDCFGLHWSHEDDPTAKKEPTDANSKSSENAKDDEQPKWELGMDTKSDGHGLVVTRVRGNAPAAVAGVNVGDELIALAGYRITSSQLPDQLEVLSEPETTLELLISRRGRLQTLAVKPVRKSKQEWKIVLDKNPSPEILKRRQQWLGIKADEITN